MCDHRSHPDRRPRHRSNKKGRIPDRLPGPQTATGGPAPIDELDALERPRPGRIENASDLAYAIEATPAFQALKTFDDYTNLASGIVGGVNALKFGNGLARAQHRLNQPGHYIGRRSAALGAVGDVVGDLLRALTIAGTVAAGVAPAGAEVGAMAEEGSGRLALGIGEHLDAFAAGQGAATWKSFPDPLNWKPTMVQKLADPNTKILFNLEGVEVWPGVSRASRGAGGATDWELLQIQRNPEWWHTIEWWKGGQQVPNPFQ